MLSIFPPDERNKTTYALSTAFVFSDAFQWNSSFFSFGKIRGSFGKNYADIDNDYSNILPVTTKKLIELGADLFFLKNRVSLTLNYFKETFEKVRMYSIPTSSGYYTTYLPGDDVRKKGTEIILGITAIRNKNLRYQIHLLGMRSKVVMGDKVQAITGNTILINSEPSWTGSLLNQILYKNFVFSTLIDMRKGGTIIEPFGGVEPTNFVTYDGTQVKLRDISLGYQFSRSFLNKIRVTRTSISASARNVLLLYSASGNDVENYGGGVLQKSASLNLSLYF
jgi:hypothetical protein